jgi:hypothetical protein
MGTEQFAHVSAALASTSCWFCEPLKHVAVQSQATEFALEFVTLLEQVGLPAPQSMLLRKE